MDDEPLILKGLKYTLEQEGYETDSATDGEEALQKFEDLCSGKNYEKKNKFNNRLK